MPLYADVPDPFIDLGMRFAGGREARQVALDVGGKNRNADTREGFRQHLQGNGLAGTGGAGDQSVTVGHAGVQGDLALAVASQQDGGVVHAAFPLVVWLSAGPAGGFAGTSNDRDNTTKPQFATSRFQFWPGQYQDKSNTESDYALARSQTKQQCR